MWRNWAAASHLRNSSSCFCPSCSSLNMSSTPPSCMSCLQRKHDGFTDVLLKIATVVSVVTSLPGRLKGDRHLILTRYLFLKPPIFFTVIIFSFIKSRPAVSSQNAAAWKHWPHTCLRAHFLVMSLLTQDCDHKPELSTVALNAPSFLFPQSACSHGNGHWNTLHTLQNISVKKWLIFQ